MTQTAINYASMTQQTGGNAQPARETNPFWYRENAPFLLGVTNAQSNHSLGVANIRLTDTNANQKQYGILAQGLLTTVVGTISFQVIVSQRTNAPYVSTISTKGNNDQYWDHVLLTPQVRAQILRHFESCLTNGGIQPSRAQANVPNNMGQQQQVANPAPAAPIQGIDYNAATGEKLQNGVPLQLSDDDLPF